MNKENVCTGELSDEQRARISRNFRAAKALLDRKRPRDTTPSSLAKIIPKNEVANGYETPASGLRIRRVPLSDISVNTPSPLPVRSSNLMRNEYNGISGGEGLSGNKSGISLMRGTTVEKSSEATIRRIEDSGNVCSKSVPVLVNRVGLSDGSSVLAENGRGADSFVTPVKLLECNGNLFNDDLSVGRSEVIDGGLRENNTGVVSVGDGFGLSSYVTPVRQQNCSGLSASSVSPGISDEDFDESFFGEIDALSEKAVHGSDGCSADIQMQSECAMKCIEDKNDAVPIILGKTLITPDALGSQGNQERPEEGLRSFRSNNDMKCIEKNNDVIPIVLEKTLITPDALGSQGNRECAEEGLRSSRSNNDSQLEGMPEEYAKYMRSLNERQREAACSDISIPLMIVAGPGSGKTSTMVGRVLMLLNEGIAPSHILAMTFTAAAASEMRDRIGKVAGKATSKELMISTFHSFSLQLCRTHAERLGRTPEFLLYCQGQQRRAIIEAVRLTESEKNVQNSDCSKSSEESVIINSPKHFKDKSKKWLKFVTQAKASGTNSEDCHKMGDEMGASILRNYENILKSCNALDYHDLISCSLKLLTDCPEVFKECQESWKAIVVDEFQDTSAMQYGLLRVLASHNHITIVGDEDQSIFSFNGANSFGFCSYRKDFPMHREVRLNKNYRSTRYIVEAASSLIQNNLKRCRSQNALTDNSSGSKITIKECSNEDAQCAFIVDKILEISSGSSSLGGSFGDVAVLYRRQVSGKKFQAAFRERKIPFNTHGVAFYRKKVVRAIMSMLRTTLPECDNGSFRRVFKALLPLEKEEKKRVIEHIDKVSTIRKCNFILAASDIFNAKISGTFKRSQLTQGRKVLLTLEIVSKLVHREQSLSAVITSVANMIPQRYLLEQRAVVDADGVKLLNEDNDLRPVLQYLLDDVSEFLTSKHANVEGKRDGTVEEKGCVNVVKDFIDFITERETENFRSRRHDNKHSVTLTTIHQSKGLEWDTVFIVKANESEIPLLHEFNGVTKENVNSLEEERRLLYVAMTRARKKLFILYVIMDSSWQVLQPSRFLREIPKHLLEIQDEPNSEDLKIKHKENPKQTSHVSDGLLGETEPTEADMVQNNSMTNELEEDSKESCEAFQACNGNNFLRRFATEERAVVSHLFNQWAKKAAFKEPKRLLDKVSFVIDERLRLKKSTHKDVLRSLKSCLGSDEAFQYAETVLRWQQIPADKRAYLMREKQEHFQKLRIESAMGSSAPTSKQISYLQNLGCTVVPISRLHASNLIEQYKSL